MFRILLTILLMTIAGAIHAAEMKGTITLRNVEEKRLQAGYVGRSVKGEQVHALAGLTIGKRQAQVWCDTFMPRRTLLTWDPEQGGSFAHTNLPPGRYLVYARYGENFLTWQMLELKSASEVKNVTLVCDPMNAGDLQVQINRPAGTYNVQVIPLDARGNNLLPGANLEFHVGSDADSQKNVATMRGLAAGKYRLELRGAQHQQNRGGGSLSIFNQIGAWTVTVKARNLARYRLP